MTINGITLTDNLNNSFTQKEDILKILITKPEDLTQFQLTELYKFYPKFAKFSPTGFSREYWTPQCRDSIFVGACRSQDENLIQDLIQLCKKERKIEPLWPRKWNEYGFFSDSLEKTILEWLETIAEIDREHLFSIVEKGYFGNDESKIIHFLVEYGKISAIQKLLQLCSDSKRLLLEKNRWGKTALHVAFEHGQAAKIKFLCEELIRHGCIQALIAPSDCYGTPLHCATINQEVEEMRHTFKWMIALLRQHIGPYALRIKDENGFVPLIKIQSAFAKILIEDFVQHNEHDDLVEQSPWGTPLFVHKTLMIEHFIATKNSEALKAKNEKGQTILHVLFDRSNYEEAKTYIAYCVQNNLIEQLWELDNEGSTPLDVAPNEKYMLLLLDLYIIHKPSLLTTRNQQGRTPLHEACLKHFPILIDTILNLYQKENQTHRIFEEDNTGKTPLMEVFRKASYYDSNHVKSALLLLKAFLGTDDQLEMTWKLYQDPKNHLPLFRNMIYTQDFSMEPWGTHKHTSAHFTKVFLREEKTQHISLRSKLALELEQATAPVFQQLEKLEFTDEVKQVRIHGRTIIFPPKNGLCDAYKFAWKEETADKLGLEATVTRIYDHSQMLLSCMPKPIQCFTVEQIPDHFKELFKDKVKPFPDGKYRVYHYQATEGYFKYLDDAIDSQQYNTSLDLCIRDRVTQLQNGIIPITAVIWHTVRDGRRFVPLADLMARVVNSPDGMGRVSRGFWNVEFSNERWIGGSDWGDFSLLFNKIKTNIRDIVSEHSSKVSSLQLHAISELYFTYSLLAIFRQFKKGEINWQKEENYKQLANDLKTVFVKVFAYYTKETEEAANRFADIQDWELMAQQISFWVDNSKETGYYNWVFEGKLPEGLFPKESEVMKGEPYTRPDYKGDQYFRQDQGFCETGYHHDFGPFSGPLGWLEFEKALYLFSIFTYNLAEFKALLH